jgi:DNA-binding protein H-NS
MSNLAELIAQKAALEQRIAEAPTHERSAAIAQIKQLMAEHGLTLADLGGRQPRHPMQARAKAARYRSSFAIRPTATPGAAAVCSPSGYRRSWPRAANSATSRFDDAAWCSVI